MSKYIIYKHTNLINQKVYIGITNKVANPNKRWLSGKGYEHNSYFTASIKRYGWENFSHEIIDYAETQLEANEKEQYWINFYQSINKDKGYNLTNGGDGISGFHHSDETKNRIAQANGKMVMCLETGIIYDSASAADRAIQISGGCVSAAILHKGTAGGNHWVFYTHDLTEQERKMLIKEFDETQYQKQRKKVLCVETNIIYPSATEAYRQTKVNNKNIGACCNGRRETAGGYHWKWVL